MDLSSLKTRLGLGLGLGYQQNENPIPLSVLFYLYETGNSTILYCNYMEGFRLLVDWLGPIDKPCNAPVCKVPKLHGSYEMQQFATILDIPYNTLYREYAKWISDYNNSVIPADSHCIPVLANTNSTN